MCVYDFVASVKEQIWKCTQGGELRIDIPAPFPKGFFLEIRYVPLAGSHTRYNYFNIWLNRKLDGQPEEVILEHLNVRTPSAEFDDTMSAIMDELNAYWTDDAVMDAMEVYKSVPVKDGKLTVGFLHFDAGTPHETVYRWFDSSQCCDTSNIRGTMASRRGYRAKLVLDTETVAKLAPLFHGIPDLAKYGITPFSTVLKKEVAFDNGKTAVYEVKANSVVQPLSAHAQLTSSNDAEWDESCDMLDTFLLHDEDGNDYFLDVVAKEMPRTMGDAIRSMNNEELAKFIFKVNHRKRFLNVGDALAYVCSVSQSGKV